MRGPRWEVEGRDWPNRAASRFVTVGRLRWHVQIFASDLGSEAPVLLLLHGTGAATHSWRTLAPLLAQQFTVVAPDLPGHGFTAGRPVGGLTMPAMARSIAELLRSMKLEPQAIVGHSAGAAIAIRMVLDGLAKPKTIVGLDAALLPFPGLASRLFPALAKALFVNPLVPHIFARIARTPGEIGRFLERSTGSRIEPAGIDCYERLFATPGHCAGAIGMMADWDLAAFERDLPSLTIPLRLLHGTADSAIPPANARAAAGRVVDGKLVPLEGLGHLAHEERPEQVAEMIAQFVWEGQS